MADARIARKDFIKGLGAAAAACVAGPVSVVAGRSLVGEKQKTVTTASLPFKARAAVKIVARPESIV